jgi:hypothetical protein
MALARALDSNSVKRLGVLSALVEAGLALSRGEKRLAGLLLGVAALSYRWSALGALLQGLLRLYRWAR